MIIVKLCCLPKSMVDSVDNLMIGTIVFLVPVFWISQFCFRTKGPKLQSKHSRETKNAIGPWLLTVQWGLKLWFFLSAPFCCEVCAIRIVRKLCFLIDAWDVKGLCLCVFMDRLEWNQRSFKDIEYSVLERDDNLLSKNYWTEEALFFYTSLNYYFFIEILICYAAMGCASEVLSNIFLL